MPIHRRMFMAGVASGAALSATGLVRPAAAATFPNKPIRLIDGFDAGGTGDFIGRVLAEALAARLGQPVVVENRPGAVSAIALNYTARSPADGYTLTLGSSASTSMLSVVKPNLNYDILKDFTYLSRLVQLDWVMNVPPKRQFASLGDLVTYAKANPGKLRAGTLGVGSATHLATLLLEQQAQIEVTTVPYRADSESLLDMQAGRIDMAYMTVLDSSASTKSGQTQALAITSQAREPLLPDVPTMTELGYAGASMTIWVGLIGPAHMPPDVVSRLVAATTEALNDPVVKQRYGNLGLRASPLTGDPFFETVVNEAKQWKTVVQTAHLVVE